MRKLGGGKGNDLASKECRAIYSRYKCGAKKRGLGFFLDLNYFNFLVQEPCIYCNSNKTQCMKAIKGDGVFYYTGIDRQDNNYGYTIKNSVPCCSMCNTFKMAYSKKVFLDHCISIVNNMTII